MAAGTGCRDGASCAGVFVLQLLCSQLQMFEEAFFFCELHPSFRPAEQHVGSRGSAVPAMLLSDRKGAAGPAAPSRIRMAADESQGEQTKPEPETAFSPSKSCRQSSRSFLAAPKWFN